MKRRRQARKRFHLALHHTWNKCAFPHMLQTHEHFNTQCHISTTSFLQKALFNRSRFDDNPPCVCLCVCLCLRVCTYMWTHTHTDTHTCLCLYVCTCVSVDGLCSVQKSHFLLCQCVKGVLVVCVPCSVSTRYTHVCITYSFIFMSVCVCVCVCACVCLCVCLCNCVHKPVHAF